MSASVAVVGFGNTIRGDDAVGPLVVDAVRARLERDGDSRLRRSEIILATAPALDLGMVEELSKCTAVILVDASEGDSGVSIQEVRAAASVNSLTSHLSSPEVFAGLMNALCGCQPKILLVAVGGKDFGLKEGISAEAKASVPVAVDTIVGTIDSIIPP